MIFRVLGYKRALPFTKESDQSLPRDSSTGLKPEPDFLAQRPDDLWEIFEIKTPFAGKLLVTSNSYRERFTAEALSYISQTITYEKYFSRNPENRNQIQKILGISVQEDLDIKIVIGLHDSIDKTMVHQKCREFHHKIDIITYDEILDRLEEEYAHNYGEFEGLAGFSFHTVVRFHATSPGRPQFLLDIGTSLERNRASFFLTERSDFVFEVRDEGGLVYDLKIASASSQLLDRWLYLMCEVGFQHERFILTTSLNGRQMDLRLRNRPRQFLLSLNDMVIGADLARENFGTFDIADKIVYARTLNFWEHGDLLSYFRTKHEGFSAVPIYVSFRGSQFMIRDKKGNFVQPDDSRRPIYRNEQEAAPGT